MNEPGAAESRSFRDRLAAAWHRLRGGSLSPGRAAASIFVGLLVGCSPFYGVHGFIVLGICIPLRLDAAISYFAAHVSNPITGPVLFLLELQVGSLLLTGHTTGLTFDEARALGFVGLVAAVGGRMLVGWMVVGNLAASLGGGITWVLTTRVRALREPERARARKKTRARYRLAIRPVRWYVRIKLVMDPALDAVAALSRSMGRVFEAGSGVGHLGLGLLDQGRATSLAGVDIDA
ncbi:MAG TPA: DUF2062 domain-containing protein, partial [Polyangiaceae bacterium]|nr:DUF2062 domain-containing protein [Polyangiaceae bacterium]